MCLFDVSLIMDVVNGRKLLMTQQWLCPSGIRLVAWMAWTPLFQLGEFKRACGSEDKWLRFTKTHINVHHDIDFELNETLLRRPRGGQEARQWSRRWTRWSTTR